MDTEVKKKALRMIENGLFVMTAGSGSEVGAGTVTWLSQASFSPPLVMAAIKADSRLHAAIESTGAFAVNILDQKQRDVASAFFRPGQVEGGRLNGYAFERGPATGSPVLADLPAWFEARVTDVIKRGDHTVYVAEVVEAVVRDASATPMSLRDTDWSYGG
jgi:flavin reductase (DIM6/NTAB) family NADH-FMN oxidoreductase RutF